MLFRTDVITKEEAIKLLKEKEKNKAEREKDLRRNGYPAYTTQVGELIMCYFTLNKLLIEYQLFHNFLAIKKKMDQKFLDWKVFDHTYQSFNYLLE